MSFDSRMGVHTNKTLWEDKEPFKRTRDVINSYDRTHIIILKTSILSLPLLCGKSYMYSKNNLSPAGQILCSPTAPGALPHNC